MTPLLRLYADTIRSLDGYTPENLVRIEDHMRRVIDAETTEEAVRVIEKWDRDAEWEDVVKRIRRLAKRRGIA